jgi:lipoyl(octanoyl) transferase
MRLAFEDLGLIDYEESVSIQRSVLQDVLDERRPDTLLFAQHPPVLTLGASFHAQNLLYPPEWYAAKGIPARQTDRGGDVTYHSSGQLVAYPIFALDRHGKDLHKWLRQLEETVICAIREFGVEGTRFSPHTGVWVEDRKVCAIGIKVRKWVSMHGLALNCDNDLEPFKWIVPCGIHEYGVTSLSQEIEERVSVETVKPALFRAFQSLFGFES